MLTISQQTILNNWLCFIVGAVANTLLLWLVWKRTPVELRAYSRILAQAGILNLAHTFTTQLFQPMILDRGAYTMICGLGWAVLDPQGGEFNRQWNILLYGTQMFTWYSSIYTTALSFYCRYVIVCSGGTLPVGPYTAGLLISTGLGLAVAISNAVAGELSKNDLNAANKVFTPEETRWIVSFVGPENDAYNIPLGLMVLLLRSNYHGHHSISASFQDLLLDFVTYVVIGYFSVRIWLHVRSQTSQIPDARARAINRQLSITLLAQALTPLVLVIGPEVYSTLVVTNVTSSQQSESDPEAFLISWLPVIDALSALIIIRPYRMVLLRALRLAKPSSSQPIMVVAASGMNTHTLAITIAPRQ